MFLGNKGQRHGLFEAKKLPREFEIGQSRTHAENLRAVELTIDALELPCKITPETKFTTPCTNACKVQICGLECSLCETLINVDRDAFNLNKICELCR